MDVLIYMEKGCTILNYMDDYSNFCSIFSKLKKKKHNEKPIFFEICF